MSHSIFTLPIQAQPDTRIGHQTVRANVRVYHYCPLSKATPYSPSSSRPPPAAIFSARPTTRSAPGYREHHDDEESQELSYPVADHTAAEGSEARALRKFYLCTMGKTWDRQRGWNTVRQDVPQDRMGEFEGVTMSPGGHTEKIQLRDNGLKTRRYRGCLCVLKRLLYSPVPDLGDVLNSLRYLTVLDLSTNSLQGDNVEKPQDAMHWSAILRTNCDLVSTEHQPQRLGIYAWRLFFLQYKYRGKDRELGLAWPPRKLNGSEKATNLTAYVYMAHRSSAIKKHLLLY